MKYLTFISTFLFMTITAFSQWQSNFGIGVDTAHYKLDVDGDINITKGHNYLIDGDPVTPGDSIWKINGDNIFYNGNKIGIGTSEPRVKLHIKDFNSQFFIGYQEAYDGPYINMIGEVAGQTPMLGMGLAQKEYNYYGDVIAHTNWAYIYGNNYNEGIAIIPDLVRSPEGLYVDKNGFVGVGTSKPESKLHVADGDIFISDIEKGIIMKSPDGNCWRGTLDNSGQLKFTRTDCPEINTGDKKKKLISSDNITISPNPTGDNITIESNIDNLSNMKYLVFNISGQVLDSGTILSNLYKIDLSSFSNGIYILKILDGNRNEISSKKIIKE